MARRGTAALKSTGPVSREKLSPVSWAKLEAELNRGPLAHGFADDQRWTLGRVKTVIGRMFHVGYTIEGVAKLLGAAWLVLAGAGTAGRRTRRDRDRGVEERGVAAGKTTAADLGAWICFADEAGQGLRPPKARTWAPRGARPVVHTRGGKGRVTVAGVVCFRAGERPRLFYRLQLYRGRPGEPKSFAWQDYRDLILTTHQQLGAPLVWCWDNLNRHHVQELVDFAREHDDWLRIYHLPAYAPELNPAEGVWSLLKRALANFIVADLKGLVRIVKRKLKKIQYRPHLISGCLAGTGLTLEPCYAEEGSTNST
ncbi:hypothetical protein GCM10010156_30180 [Planobispora rosea]|nr:hypothetical protein GCM10010156_30180 [Planobispora rosea]